MQARQVLGAAACCAMLIATLMTAGCKTNAVDKSAFKSAINNYLGTQKECVWPAPKKFPAQADTSNDDETKGYDALTDAGLLVRSSAEKKRFLIGSKQVNDYDLSDKGRSTWTADPSQPGYGNFCYGHREVTTVDDFTPPDNADATQYVVNYHYDISNLPGWASSAEMKTAFPKIANETASAQPATATLVKSSNGWMVNNATTADGKPVLPQ